VAAVVFVAAFVVMVACCVSALVLRLRHGQPATIVRLLLAAGGLLGLCVVSFMASVAWTFT
jgi:hypothetical protein